MPKSGKPTPGYRLTELIGKGSFGRVYKANDLKTASVVAVKIIDVDERSSSRLFTRDTETLSISIFKVLEERVLLRDSTHAIFPTCSIVDDTRDQIRGHLLDFDLGVRSHRHATRRSNTHSFQPVKYADSTSWRSMHIAQLPSPLSSPITSYIKERGAGLAGAS
ncbi:hypothetical protein F4821DRAFT_249925 [Hypoxylon rubiginosum]|uniref:Uncharacterized protein n=1 Tax=Hypoxylon rubiginosum TaxID=110542 RepID=A0ACC0CL93_9PEZI|nr:hypothetical protein F4821DRAFT_249925 [Hypoxylon rubiginosum]